MAGQVQPVAERGELPGHRAERGRRVGRPQGRDDVAEAVGPGGQRPGPVSRPEPGKSAAPLR